MRKGMGMLLALATLVEAQDEDLLPVQWEIGEKGETRFEAGGVDEPLFPEDSGDFFKGLSNGGLASMLLFAFPGPVDLASLADAELHFRRLELGTTDEEIARRVAAAADNDRARLDRLLAVRLAGSRKIARLVPTLEELATSEDPILARAARTSLARIAGKAPPPERWKMPPVPIDALQGAGIVAFVDCARIPSWGDLAAVSRRRAVAETQDVIKKLGAAVTPADLADGQRTADSGGEWFYEAARRFGNMRVHRIAVGMRFTPAGDPSVRLVADGRFDPGRFAARFQTEGLEAKRRGAGVALLMPANELKLAIDPERLAVAFGKFEGEASAALKQAAAIDAAVVVAILPGAQLPQQLAFLPGFGGLKHGTLTMRFKGGVNVKFVGTYADERTAKQTVAILTGLLNAAKAREKKLEPLIDAIEFAREGTAMTVTFTAEGKTPLDLVGMLTD